jgi:toxin FitB
VILLDTNVISEMMRPKPDSDVESWFESVEGLPLYISAITEGELWAGLHRLAAGKRRNLLTALIQETLERDFGGRVLPFDSAAAKAFGKINADRLSRGRPIDTADCQIAAIASVKGLRLATRNIRDFDYSGIVVLDPWSGKTFKP